jgi:S-adenosylmethionine-diacylgycerolhomoserine-N-methlytransferase
MSDAAGLMDKIYRHQRHIYDASRKFYLLGRDTLIEALDPPAGGQVLEVGCGTGRNLIKIARTYPEARCYGFDISSEMLVTARRSIMKAGLPARITLAQADATAFDARTMFGVGQFDCIVISYALSMMPGWEKVLVCAMKHLKPEGSIHIVDFGNQAGLPSPFRTALNRWLALFHVTPRLSLQRDLEVLTRSRQMRVRSESLYRGYTIRSVIERAA